MATWRRHRVAAAFGGLAALAMAMACDDPQAPADTEPPINSPAELVAALAAAYDARDLETIGTLLSDRADAPYLFQIAGSQYGDFPLTYCDRQSEMTFHRRLFRPAEVAAGEEPVPEALRPASLDATFAPRGEWSERTDLYVASTGPTGLDPNRWRALGATYDMQLRLSLSEEFVYLVHSHADLVVLEDRTREAGARGKYVLCRWRDDSPFQAGAAAPQQGAASPQFTWASLHAWYLPTAGITSECLLMLEYETAYQRKDSATLGALLAQDPTATFHFILGHPSPEGATEWAADQEILLHRRLFSPGYLPPGDPPVPASLWPRALQAEITATEPFVERTDLYALPPSQPTGLDPAVWRASAAVYGVYLLVALPAGTDYQVSERVRCTVIENRTIPLGQPGKFLLYRMEELADPTTQHASPAGVEAITWGALKSLYRPLRLDSGAGLVAAFLDAYRRHDPVAFDALLAREADAAYRFLAPGQAAGGGDVEWDAAEESRLQRRMFNPDLRGPDETAVRWFMRLHSGELVLQAQAGWTERPELYRSDTNLDGLDPARWRATSNRFSVDAWFKNIILNVFLITGEAEFVVLEDRALAAGTTAKFLLYRWIDRTQDSNPAGDPTGTTTLSWTAFKRLYD